MRVFSGVSLDAIGLLILLFHFVHEYILTILGTLPPTAVYLGSCKYILRHTTSFYLFIYLFI